MKKITNTLFGASLLLAAVLGINSCRKPSVEGDVVRFSARTFSSPLTKTEYSGVVSGGKERIDWLASDEITIECAKCTPTSEDYRVTGTITPQGANSEADALTPVSGNGLQWGTGSHTFYAVYPAGKASFTAAGVARATFPATQVDAGTDLDPDTGMTTMVPDMRNAFMYAKQTASPGDDVELTFNPMFTAFQFTVGGDGTGDDYVTLKSVDLISTSCALSGGFSLNIDDTTYTIPDWEEDTNDKITYNFPTGTTINTNQKVCFTLFVQPRSKVSGKTDKITDLTIRFTLDGGATRALKLKYDADHGGAFVDFPGGKKINIDGLTLPTQLKSWSFTVLNVDAWDSDTPDVLYGSPVVVEPEEEEEEKEEFVPDVTDLVPWDWYEVCSSGICFSVSEYRKVRFSPGNLQYNKNTGKWSFMAHQYDTVETQDQDVGENYIYQDVVSLFGWGTSGHAFASGYGSAYQPWSTSTTSTDYGPTNAASGLTGAYADGDWGVNMGSGWRTLSSGEWNYLLHMRGGGERNYPRYCKARVEGVPGLVIFPDGYSDLSGINNDKVNTSDASYYSNSLSGDVWAMKESAGCVFLPAAGYRYGSSVSNSSSNCYYWSSSSGSTQYASYISIRSNEIKTVSASRSYGCSVRLVKDL